MLYFRYSLGDDQGYGLGTAMVGLGKKITGLAQQCSVLFPDCVSYLDHGCPFLCRPRRTHLLGDASTVFWTIAASGNWNEAFASAL